MKRGDISRTYAVIGTAGHIDHGKTSLVKALTGLDTDTLKEEKERGVSINLGFAYMDIKGLSHEGGAEKTTRVAIIDVPGHERFIRNMLAGVTGIDMVLFAVAADDGVMPQTIEHLDIVGLLGVRKGIFAVTKKDAVTGERLKEVEEEIRGLIRGTRLEGSPVIPVSSTTGEGIEELKRLIKERVVDVRRTPPGGFFRLPVDRSFAMRGFGTVVTGTVAGGVLRKGDEVICFPGVVKARVRGLQSLYLDVDEVREGERAAVNLSGVSHNDIRRGAMLIAPELGGYAEYAALEEELCVDSFFRFLPDKGEGRRVGPVKSGSILKLHHFTGETPVKVRFSGGKGVEPGEKAFGRLILKRPLIMLKGDHFILRNPALNSTIGGGSVYMPHLSKATLQKINWVRPPSMDEAEEGGGGVSGLRDHIARLLPDNALSGFDLDTLSIMLNAPAPLLEGYLGQGGPLFDSFSVLGGYAVKRTGLALLKEKVLASITDFHGRSPSDRGIRDEDLFKTLKPEIPHGFGAEAASLIFKSCLMEMAGEALIMREGAISWLPSLRTSPDVSPDRATLALKGLFSAPGFSSVNMDEIRGLPFGKEELERSLKGMAGRGEIVRLKENSFISREDLEAASGKLVEYIKAHGGIKASEMRDILGCGRKLAIEILEHFDKERLTLRKGDIRVLRGLETVSK